MDPVNDSPIQPPSSGSQLHHEDPPMNSQSFLPPAHRVTFNHPLAIKHEDKNYLLWCRQVLTTIKGHNLGHFLDHTTKTPPQFNSPKDALNNRVLEEIQLWEQQDQLILSWLMASMSDSIFTLVVDYDFTWQVWEKIQMYFASHTKARVQQLKIELQNTSKGTQSVSEYLLRIKVLVDLLVPIGCAVSEQEHIEVILGLSADYDAFVTSITMQSDPYSIVEVEAHLMAQEAQI